MTVVKKITRIDTRDTEYTVGTIIRQQYEVKDISFKRDGYSGINKDGKDESHYLIHLINELEKDDIIFELIPKAEVKKITFVEKEVKTEKEEIKLERV
jgi:hypothetical protein